MAFVTLHHPVHSRQARKFRQHLITRAREHQVHVRWDRVIPLLGVVGFWAMIFEFSRFL